jgi:hypothetical protein
VSSVRGSDLGLFLAQGFEDPRQLRPPPRLGFGRIVVSEIETPNMLANTV